MINIFGRKRVAPITLDDVEAAPPPSPEIEAETSALGIQIMSEVMQTASISGQIREALAAGVLIELRGGKQ